jgi:hypothetical protein
LVLLCPYFLQLAGLAGLHTLAIKTPFGVEPTQFSRLEGVTQLERLSFTSCPHLPACASDFVALRALNVSDMPLPGWQLDWGLEPALQQLPQLTHLVLRNCWLGPDGLPASLGGLAQLQRFCWTPDWAGDSTTNLALPPGPWLASLRQLALDIKIASLNLARVSQATQLQDLVLDRCKNSNAAGGDNVQRAARFSAVAAWAAHHPSLRRFGLCDARLVEQGCAPAWTEMMQQIACLHRQAGLEVCDGFNMICTLLSL